MAATPSPKATGADAAAESARRLVSAGASRSRCAVFVLEVCAVRGVFLALEGVSRVCVLGACLLCGMSVCPACWCVRAGALGPLLWCFCRSPFFAAAVVTSIVGSGGLGVCLRVTVVPVFGGFKPACLSVSCTPAVARPSVPPARSDIAPSSGSELSTPSCHYFQCSDMDDVTEWTVCLRVQMLLVRGRVCPLVLTELVPLCFLCPPAPFELAAVQLVSRGCVLCVCVGVARLSVPSQSKETPVTTLWATQASLTQVTGMAQWVRAQA